MITSVSMQEVILWKLVIKNCRRVNDGINKTEK